MAYKYNDRTGNFEFDDEDEESSSNSNNSDDYDDSYDDYSSNRNYNNSYNNNSRRNNTRRNRPQSYNPRPNYSRNTRNNNSRNNSSQYYEPRQNNTWNNYSQYNYPPQNNTWEDNSTYDDYEYQSNDDISWVTKIAFVAISLLLNYIAYKINWCWLFFTVIWTLVAFEGVFKEYASKNEKIAFIIGNIATLLTVVTPLPWWSVIASSIITMVVVNKIRDM